VSENETEAVVFERVSGSRTRGCIAYLLMVPMFALIGGLVGGAAGMGLLWILNVDKTMQEPLGLLLFSLGALFFAYWGIRDYFRRAGTRVRVHEESLEVLRSNKSYVYSFEDLEWIEGTSSTELSLKCSGRGPLVFKAEEWPLKGIHKALARTAVPRLVYSFNSRIESGETLEFRPANIRGVKLRIGGVSLVVLAGYLVYRWLFVLTTDRSPFQLGLPFFLSTTGATCLVRSRQARGGVLVEKAGIRPRKDAPLTPWPRVREITLGEQGARIELDNGEVITVGRLTRNYDACVAVLRTWAVTTL
jgi:hypothetical protein